MKPAPDTPGFVLVSVLWVVALLTVVTLSFGYRARLEAQAARYSLDATQARLAARGAVEAAILQLRNKHVLDRTEGAPAPVTHLSQAWARTGDLQSLGLLTPDPALQQEQITFQIEDLDRYVDINTAPEALIDALPGIDRSVARRIRFRRTGEENTADTDAAPKAPFHDLAELRTLEGLSDRDWFGSAGEPGLQDLVAVHGDGRVNVNTAPESVLALVPEVGEGLAGDIVALRNGPDGESGTGDDRGWAGWDQFSADTGIQGTPLQSLQRLCKFDSTYFKITAVATRRGGRIMSSCIAVVRVAGEAGDATLVSWTEDSLGAQ